MEAPFDHMRQACSPASHVVQALIAALRGLAGLYGLRTAIVAGTYSTVTLLARLRGWSTSVPRSTATW